MRSESEDENTTIPYGFITGRLRGRVESLTSPMCYVMPRILKKTRVYNFNLGREDYSMEQSFVFRIANVALLWVS